MDYAPEDPTPPPPPAPDSASPPDAASDPNYAPPLEELLKDIPKSPPLPKWNDPELRYMPKGSGEGQPPVTTDDAWRKVYGLVEKYDKGMCESYREQIDTLLVFAGLFSAVVTAFAVESYQWLQDDPADASAELLRQAVVLLSALANQTSSPAATQRGPTIPDSAVVRINIYWFLSLVLSLSAALIGIVCKQWLREYERDIGQSVQQALAVRQMKFEGLEAWGVGAIVTSVPLILQLALALFLIGISELLLHLHQSVAIAVTTVSGLTGAFYIITASAPLWQYLYLSILSRMQIITYRNSPAHPLPGRAFTRSQCPYKSPQAWLALRVYQPFIDWIMFHDYEARSGHQPDSWVSFDAYWTARRDGELMPAETTTSRALTWTAHALGETHLDAWRLLCARHYLAHAGGSMSYRATHVEDTEDDGMQYQLLSSLEGVHAYDVERWAILLKQEELFCSSCRAKFDVNTSVELFLQLAAFAPFDPQWFSRGLAHIWASFLSVQHTLNDDMAIELLRVLQDKLSSDHTSLQDSDWLPSMLLETVDILIWAPSRTLFLLAVCAVAVRFVQSSTAARPTPLGCADTAFFLLRKLRNCELPSSTEIQQLRGFGHIVALAQFILDNPPKYIDNKDVREVFDRLGLRQLYEERLPRVQHGSDGLRSDTVSEHAEAHLTPDVQLSPVTRSATVVSTAANSTPIDDTRLPETEIATHTAAAGRGYGNEFAAPHSQAPHQQELPTFGVSAAPVLHTDAGPAIELHDMPARAGDADDASLIRADPHPGMDGVVSTSGPPAPHIAIPIEPPDMRASISGPTPTSHDPEAP